MVSIGDQYIVWYAVKNQYANIKSADDTYNLTFPCNKEELQHWLDNTVSDSSSNNLYNSFRVSDGVSPPPGTYQDYPFPEMGESESIHTSLPSRSTGCGPLINTVDQESSRTPYNDPHDISSTMTGQKNTAATSLYGGSYDYYSHTSAGGETCFRVTDFIDYTMGDHSVELYDGVFGRNGYCNTKSWVSMTRENTIITPIGEMGTLIYSANGNHDSGDMYSGAPWSRDIHREGANLNLFWSDRRYLFTKNSMVQIYVLHALEGQEQSTDISNTWLGDVLYDFETGFVATSRTEFIRCACDFFEDTDIVDPSTQSINSAFEAAVKSLIEFHYSEEGISATELTTYTLYLTIRQYI